MQISVRGFARDHGSWIMIDEDLSDHPIAMKASGHCPASGYALEEQIENDAVTSIAFKQRIRANLNGNYVLEIKLTSSDIAALCWLAFRKKALSVLLRIFSTFEAFAIEMEEMAARRAENRRALRRI